MSEATGFTTFQPLDTMIDALQRNHELLVKNQNELEERLTNLEMAHSLKTGYYTMGSWLRLTGLSDTHHDLVDRLYEACSKLSKERGVLIENAPDAEYGTVNSYHKSILQEIVGVGEMYDE